MATKVDWNEAIKPLLKKYKGKKHPLEYRNLYELVVMVVLSAQTTDKLVNDIASKLFEAFPTFESLGRADVDTLIPYISKITSFRKKGEWLIKIARLVKEEKNIPLMMEGLTDLSGIGRKSANVIMREAKVKAAGVIVDLHVLRVANRLGIAKGDEAKSVEQQIMKKVDEKYWDEIGMAISFLGREICRPTDPMHEKCVIKNVCSYYAKEMKRKK